jgi:osmotically-inducible protein OsmY
MSISVCTTFVLLAAIIAAAGCDKRSDTVPSAAGTQPSGNGAATPAASKTPMDQSESAVHIKITADIRREILDDKSMSTNAQNCKVITDSNGRVTLRGAVDTQAERDSIGAKASRIAGGTNVDNLLEVKTK